MQQYTEQTIVPSDEIFPYQKFLEAAPFNNTLSTPTIKRCMFANNGIPKSTISSRSGFDFFALRCAKKSKPLRDDMVDFGIPLFANIHLCGSVLTEVFFVMTVSKILYGNIPSLGTMILFCVLLGVFAIGAPGVPGGTVMASLDYRCLDLMRAELH